MTLDDKANLPDLPITFGVPKDQIEGWQQVSGEVESVSMPPVGVYVNVDVNDLLGIMTETEVFEFLGKLKDLFES